MRADRRWIALLAPSALAALAVAGCAGSGALDPALRGRAEPQAPEQWHPLEPAALDGLYESERIEGEAAAALWKIEYHFGADGSFCGAALVFGERGAEFQALGGAWSVPEPGRLRLGDDEARAQVDGERLRLELDGGVVILRREALR